MIKWLSNITGQINNIFFEDKKLTIVYENQEGDNFKVYIGEDEFTDEFIEILSNEGIINEIIIYPNPTSNKIKILQQDKFFSISIYNITGLEIYSLQDLNSETDIDLSKLPIGNYWLKINNSDKMYSLQINR